MSCSFDCFRCRTDDFGELSWRLGMPRRLAKAPPRSTLFTNHVLDASIVTVIRCFCRCVRVYTVDLGELFVFGVVLLFLLVLYYDSILLCYFGVAKEECRKTPALVLRQGSDYLTSCFTLSFASM